MSSYALLYKVVRPFVWSLRSQRTTTKLIEFSLSGKLHIDTRIDLDFFYVILKPWNGLMLFLLPLWRLSPKMLGAQLLVLSIIQSSLMSVRLSLRLKLKISVTTEPIELYSSGIIPTGPVVVLSYFLGEWDTPNPSKMKVPPHKKKFWGNYFTRN